MHILGISTIIGFVYWKKWCHKFAHVSKEFGTMLRLAFLINITKQPFPKSTWTACRKMEFIQIYVGPCLLLWQMVINTSWLSLMTLPGWLGHTFWSTSRKHLKLLRVFMCGLRMKNNLVSTFFVLTIEQNTLQMNSKHSFIDMGSNITQ